MRATGGSKRTSASTLGVHPRRGFALLAVLWVTVTIVIIALATTLASREALASARNRRALHVSAWGAEGCAAIARAVIDEALASSTASMTSRRTPAWQHLDRIVAESPAMSSSGCTVSLSAAGRSLDVNRATGEQLRKSLYASGVPFAAADSIADAILDWRDADDEPRAAGAERSWYASARRAQPRNGRIAHAEELTLVRGAERVPNLGKVLAVDDARVSIVAASRPVLAALPGFTDEAVNAVLSRRARGEPLGGILELTAHLSRPARDTLIRYYAELEREATVEPEAWILWTRAGGGGVPEAVVEMRLVFAAGDAGGGAAGRAAVVRRMVRP